MPFAILFFPVVAHAQWWGGSTAKDGVKITDGQFTRVGGWTADSTARMWAMDALGNGKVAEQFPLSDQNLTFTYIINDDSLAVGSADSSIVLDTHRMRLGMLIFKLVPRENPNGTAQTVSRIAFQVRTHVNGGIDSLSTAAIYLYGSQPSFATTTTAVADTSEQGHLFAGSASVPWSGEYVLTASLNREAYGSSKSVTGSEFYYPSAIAIPLSSIAGREIYSPYTSVRVRNLAGQKCAVYVHLVATPL